MAPTEAAQSSEKTEVKNDKGLNPEVDSQRYSDTWTVLLGLRAVNAVTLATFFQPDEFYQAFEPAWNLAFGPSSGAWMTWEWKHQLRSSIQPIALAGVYSAVSKLTDVFSFPPTLRTQLLLLMPKALHAGIAAMQDYGTWRLAERIYGANSYEALATLALTAFSPWQWYVSTRPLSNGLEAALTAMALAYWPWEWLITPAGSPSRKDEKAGLRYCFFLAGLACVLRPTNILIWAVLLIFTLLCANQEEALQLILAATVQGTAVLGISQGIDRWYYGVWTFPAARWLQFNLSQNLAVFYGENRADYYITEGLPILLTTALPFALVGISKGVLGIPTKLLSGSQRNVRTPLRALAIAALTTPAILTLISHKEVRFLYTLLPILLTLTASPFASFFHPIPIPPSGLKKLALYLTVGINVLLGAYFGLYHNRGVMDITTYLRNEYILQNPDLVLHRAEMSELSKLNPMTVGFLMPCHSTPWRSHLVYPGIDAWALTCEPPVGMPLEERASYLDEADLFYADPKKWVSTHMESTIAPSSRGHHMITTGTGKRTWPQYLVFFEQLEPIMKDILQGTKYEECWRGFNTRWHDDKRRQGDVIVQCADFGLKVELSKDEIATKGQSGEKKDEL